MTTPADKIAVRFIGRKAPWTDNLYGTNLTFAAGQVRAVPAQYAKQFLKHGDCFELADAEPAAPVAESAPQDTEQEAPVDDTDAILEQAEQEREEQKEEQNRIEDLRQKVMLCESKDELADMALANWNQKLNKQMSVENMRTKVVGFIDQFGIV